MAETAEQRLTSANFNLNGLNAERDSIQRAYDEQLNIIRNLQEKAAGDLTARNNLSVASQQIGTYSKVLSELNNKIKSFRAQAETAKAEIQVEQQKQLEILQQQQKRVETRVENSVTTPEQQTKKISIIPLIIIPVLLLPVLLIMKRSKK